MYRCITEISFEQVTQVKDLPARNLKFTFNFVNEFTATDAWTDITNTCKIKFPKNIYVKDPTNPKKLIPLGGTQPSKLINDLFLRGDKVTVKYGYYLENGKVTKDSLNTIFIGYISKVQSKKPIELECENNMWLLKQISCKRQVVPATETIQSLVKRLLVGTAGAGFTISTSNDITVGQLVIDNETIAQLLMRLRKEFHLESYFYGNELRIGLSPYVQSLAVKRIFKFQQNIISDELQWNRKDDIKLSAVCQSMNTVQGKPNKKGETKTKKEQLSVLVYNDNGVYKSITKKKGVDFPANEEGERRTLFFPNVQDPQKLAALGIAELTKYYYDGFKGSFLTFAYPLVRLGDYVQLIDKLMPDRNGTYVVREVEYTGGTGGHRQKITLDYKLTK